MLYHLDYLVILRWSVIEAIHYISLETKPDKGCIVQLVVHS